MGRIILLILIFIISLMSLTMVTSCPYRVPEGKIFNIPDNSLPPGLISLVFHNQPLTNISDDALQDSVNTLNHLSITNAQFKILPKAIFELTNLTSLTIKTTYFDVLNKNALYQIGSTVKTLTLKDIGLTSWPSWLSYFISLTVLDLSHSNAKSLPDDAFVYIKDTLTHLTLSSFWSIKIPKALSFLRNLTYLDLSSSGGRADNGRLDIKRLNSFPCASTLQVLNISVTVSGIMPNLSNMTALKLLNVEFSGVNEIITGSLPSGLTHLNLRFNKLNSIPAAITELPHLTLLNLAANNLTEINFNQVPPTVDTLYLGVNKITNITGRKSHLRVLALNVNPISNISSTAFNNLPSLESLYLSNLDLIPLALTSLTKLRLLMLSVEFCPQPPPKELVYWFRSLVQPKIEGRCNNDGGHIADYMRGCQPDSPCDACTLVHSMCCSFGCLLLLLTASAFI